MPMTIWQILTVFFAAIAGVTFYFAWRLRNSLEASLAREEKSYQELSNFPDTNPHPIMQLNQAGMLLYANPASYPILANWQVSLNEKIPAPWREVIRQVVLAEKKQTIELAIGKYYYALDIIPMAEGLVAVFGIDISTRKAVEKELEQRTTVDEFTKLPNRIIFAQNLGLEINHAKVAQKKFGILILKVADYFEIINTYGQQVGAEFLKIFCDRLMDFISSQTVARLADDEFGIIAASINDPSPMAAFTQALIEKCTAVFPIAEKEIFITLNAGISFYPTDGSHADELIRNAQLALNRTNQMRNQYEFFQRGMIEQLQEKRSIISDLHKALEQDQFSLYYQPQIHLKKRQMIGAEALIRWNHPQKGFISPYFFMTAAEETHLIEPIGEWVLRQACQQIVKWQQEGYPAFKVAVNVSARQLFQTDFVATVKRIIQETHIDVTFLELELTESALVQDINRAIEMMKSLRDLGVGLALDDFGTGYSSLNYLMKFPITKLKIDRSFIKAITEENFSKHEIIKGIIELGHSLNLHIVAEGVETKLQLQYLKDQNCDSIQGFYFAQPQPVEKFVEFFNQNWKT